MNLIFRKTYAVVIVTLAAGAARKHLSLDIPPALLVALFVLSVICMCLDNRRRGTGVSPVVFLCVGLSLLCGCAYTRIERGDVKVTRIAVLYPAKFGHARVSTTNEVWEVGDYESDGGAGGAAAITAAAVEAGVKSAIKK